MGVVSLPPLWTLYYCLYYNPKYLDNYSNKTEKEPEKLIVQDNIFEQPFHRWNSGLVQRPINMRTGTASYLRYVLA